MKVYGLSKVLAPKEWLPLGIFTSFEIIKEAYPTHKWEQQHNDPPTWTGVNIISTLLVYETDLIDGVNFTFNHWDGTKPVEKTE